MPAPVLRLLSVASADTSDADLLARFVATRDEPAFAELVRRHGPIVYRVCHRLVGPSSADDAFQATFLVFACRARSVRKAGSVGSWLIGVAGRVSRQMRRRMLRASSEPERQRGADLPDARLLTAELGTILDDEVTRLPDQLRNPVVLCLVQGRTHEQAARELGGSVRTLRRRLDQAKALLRVRLERRGVVPAVGTGLVASVGSAPGVPPEVSRSTIAGVFDFLTGTGAATPATVIAKGVLGSMAKLKLSVAMAAATVALIGLGVGLAGDDGTTPTPIEPPVTRKALGSPTVRVVEPPPARTERSVSHRTPNFVVSAPTAVMARAIANEAEYQRRELAKQWLGKELSDWDQPCPVEFRPDTGSSGASVFTFGRDGNGKPVLTSRNMELHGSFLKVMENNLPHEVMHTVLATHFGRPLPRWADEGIATLAESEDEQLQQDIRVRELLNVGRGIRLKSLFTMHEYPKDVMVVYAQGHSVVRFLLGTRPVRPLIKSDYPIEFVASQSPEAMLLRFIETGIDGNTVESWDKAAKVYDFESVDEVEAAWLEWIRKPPSRLKPEPTTQPVDPHEKPAEPELIPPVKLPDVRGATVIDATTTTARTRKLIIPYQGNHPDSVVVLKSVRLYVSRDQGKTWELHTSIPVGETLMFEAPEDGVYWLAGVAVKADGTTDPKDLTDLRPQVKVRIDTSTQPDDPLRSPDWDTGPPPAGTRYW